MLRVDSKKRQLGKLVHLAPGVVPVVISLRRYFLRPTRVGVRRKSIHVHWVDCLRIHVGRPARGLVRAVLIHATQFAMPVLVHCVRLWVPRRIVFVVETPPQSVVRIRTTRMGGAVVRSAVTCCPVVSMLVLDGATKVSAVPVMSKSRHVATVEVCRLKCYAVQGMKGRIVRDYVIHQVMSKVGRAVLAVENSAIAHSTAVFISARRTAMLRMHSPHIVRGRLMWYLIAHVERRC